MDRHWLITCTAVFSHVSPQDTAAAIVYEQKHFALIVVDERLIGKLLAKTLKSSGYQICDMVASGEEVIAVAKRKN